MTTMLDTIQWQFILYITIGDMKRMESAAKRFVVFNDYLLVEIYF